jgi:hypothetical protein
MAIPAFTRAALNARAVQARAAVLQTACMMRMAELAADTTTTIPRTLQELSARTGKPVPLDPLGAKPGQNIFYEVHPENGTYLLRHSPGVKPYAGDPPYEFRGKWRPE